MPLLSPGGDDWERQARWRDGNYYAMLTLPSSDPTESREKRAGWKPFYGRAKISTKQKIPFRLVEQKATNEIFLPSLHEDFCVKKIFIQGKTCTPTIVLWSVTDVKQQRQPSRTVSEGTLHAELCETLVTSYVLVCICTRKARDHAELSWQTVRSWISSQTWIHIQFYVERFVTTLPCDTDSLDVLKIFTSRSALMLVNNKVA